MDILIPYGNSFSATLSGAILKLVHCESCHAEYVYRMERTATGQGTSLLFLDNDGARNRAAASAKQSLRSQLEREVDVVPCPVCGWYQSQMLPKARRDHAGWMRNAGLVLLITAIIAWLVAFVTAMGPDVNPPWIVWTFGSATLVTGSVGVGLLAIKAYLSSHYDPNAADQGTRIRAGQSRAILMADLEKMMQAQQLGPEGV